MKTAGCVSNAITSEFAPKTYSMLFQCDKVFSWALDYRKRNINDNRVVRK